MSNVLADDNNIRFVALERLGWSLRRIEETAGVRRETISGHLKAAGIVVRGPGRRRQSRATPAIPSAEVSPRDIATGQVASAPLKWFTTS